MPERVAMSLSRWYCVPILRDTWARGVLTLVARHFRCETWACMFSGEAELWNVLARYDCWNLGELVSINPGRAGFSADYPSGGVFDLVDMSSR